MPIKKKSNSFLIEGSLLAALDKNRIEAKNLKNYCEKLDKNLCDNFFKIEKQNYENYRFLRDLKQDRLNSDSKLTMLNDTPSRSPAYFDLMKTKAFDSTNEYLPDLLKSVREQEIRSAKSVRELLDYNGKKQATFNVLANRNDLLRAKHSVSLNETSNDSKRNLQFEQRCLSSNPRLYDYNVMSAMSVKSGNTVKSEDYALISASFGVF